MLTRFHLMEASISFHSFLIGLGIGFAQGGWRAQLVLGGSLCVHQFFEGAAVGTVGKTSQLSQGAWRWTFVIFSLSLPAGVASAVTAQLLASVGSNAGYQWALGLLTACAAGSLTHIGVEMISHELDDESGPQEFTLPLTRWGVKPASCPRVKVKMAAICLGASIMAVLAIWA